MNDPIQNDKYILTNFFKLSSFTDKTASISIIIYCVGYLVNAIFLKSFGSIDIPIVKSEFITAGLSFFVITFSFIILPLLYFIIRDLKELRSRRKIGIKRSYLIVANYCIILIIFTMFVTSEEWNNKIIIYQNVTVLLKNIFLVYFMGVLVGIVVLSVFEGACTSLRKRSIDNKWFGIHDETSNIIRFYDKSIILFLGFWRWAFLAISFAMDYLLFTRINWFFNIFWSMKFYLGMIFILVFVVLRLRNAKRESDKKNNDKLSYRISMIGITIIPIILYLTIFSYSFSVYRLMPKNRGGMMPLYKTVFYINRDIEKCYPSSIYDANSDKSKPLYILFSTENYYYVTDKYKLKQKDKVTDTDHMKQIWAIRKKDIINMQRVRSNPRYVMHP